VFHVRKSTIGAHDDDLLSTSSLGQVAAEGKDIAASSARMALASLPPPFTYEGLYSSYKNQWVERKRSLATLQQQGSVQISDLEWFQTEDDPEYNYLLGCTNTGHVAIWKFSKASTATMDGDIDQDMLAYGTTKPVAHVQLSQHPLYTIERLDQQNSFLITGVDGIVTVEFRQLLRHQSTTQEARAPWDWWKDKSLGSIQHAVTFQSHVYAVNSTGDAFKFELEGRQCVSTYKHPSPSCATRTIDKSHGVQSTIALLRPSENAASNSLLLLVGRASSGKVLIWDVSKDQGMDTLNVGEAISSSCCNNRKHRPFYVFGSTHASAAQQQQQQLRQPSVSTIHATDNWWTIAGSQQGPRQPLDGGFLSTWHGPTRSLVSCTHTSECIQKIASLSVSSPGGTTSSDTRLVSVGNEGVVSCWDSVYSLQRTHRVWCSPPSIKSIAVLPWNSGMTSDTTMAIGGIGPNIDLLEDYCKTQTVTL
jgi:hypothetical protein